MKKVYKIYEIENGYLFVEGAGFEDKGYAVNSLDELLELLRDKLK